MSLCKFPPVSLKLLGIIALPDFLAGWTIPKFSKVRTPLFSIPFSLPIAQAEVNILGIALPGFLELISVPRFPKGRTPTFSIPFSLKAPSLFTLPPVVLPISLPSLGDFALPVVPLAVCALDRSPV